MKTRLLSLCIGISVLGASACGTSNKGSSVRGGASGAPGTVLGGSSGDTNVPPGSGAGTTQIFTDPGGGSTGLDGMCDGGNCACAPGNTTTIEGYVYDPAGKNPLYNISVYVPDPGSPLPNLDSVPVACGCTQLFPAKVLATGAPTDATGHFVIPCAPSGTVSLVVQTGKWRRQYDGIAVMPNQPNKTMNLRLPANSMEGSLPNIAISTGASDSFECLPLRMGVSASEYVSGSATGGHIHIYSGFGGATLAPAVESYQGLWDSQAHLNEHDVVILSCEGQETTGGQRAMPVGATEQGYLMSYANTGGRVFASHFQYAWFNTGPFATGSNNIATWMPGSQHVDDTQAFPVEIDTTLASGAPFPEGLALSQWLGTVGALTNNQLPVWFARDNVLTVVQPPSTEWAHLAASVTQAPSSPQYFSVDTPSGGTPGGPLCGRVVYSDLHVGGIPGTNAPGVPVDYPRQQGGGNGGMRTNVAPDGCAMHPLTPQEEALEFMLFDLSSCLVPIGQTPPETVIPR